MDIIRSIRIQNYGCIQDETLKLGSLHALIGPNASGKSTLLRAFQLLGAATRKTTVTYQEGRWHPFFPGLRPGNGAKACFSLASAEASVRVSIEGPWEAGAKAYPPGNLRGQLLVVPYDGNMGLENSRMVELSLAALFPREIVLMHPSPSNLRQPAIIDGYSPLLKDELGSGLPALLDAILTRDVDGFLAIREQVRRYFPSIKNIGLETIGTGLKGLEATLTDGRRISASEFSEGLLYFLLFAALRYMDPPGMLLVEEPENGLHPARIKEVMAILKEISKTTQVLIATHSPLVINELEPEQVSIVTCPRSTGTRITPLTETIRFKERSEIYALGELWLSYADGEFEEQLTGPLPAATELP